MQQRQIRKTFLNAYITQATECLSTVIYSFDGRDAANHRGYHVEPIELIDTIPNARDLVICYRSEKWLSNSMNYDNHWMALREAHYEWERLFKNQHSLAVHLMNLECCPANMMGGHIEEPAETLLSSGFKVLTKNDPSKTTGDAFFSYLNKMLPTTFTDTVRGLNFVH